MVIAMLFHFGHLDLIIKRREMTQCQALTKNIGHLADGANFENVNN